MLTDKGRLHSQVNLQTLDSPILAPVGLGGSDLHHDPALFRSSPELCARLRDGRTSLSAPSRGLLSKHLSNPSVAEVVISHDGKDPAHRVVVVDRHDFPLLCTENRLALFPSQNIPHDLASEQMVHCLRK